MRVRASRHRMALMKRGLSRDHTLDSPRNHKLLADRHHNNLTPNDTLSVIGAGEALDDDRGTNNTFSVIRG